MKNISIIFTLILLMTSCQDEFLDINSETDLTTGNYFKTVADMESAVNGIYAALPDIYNEAWMLGEFASDNTYYQLNISRGDVEEEEQIANHQMLRANPNLATKFEANYRLIARANQVLVSFESGDFEPAFEDPKRGEALFLRSLAYFDLVRYFGDIPLVTTPATSFEETRQPAVAPNVIFELIKSDVAEAASLLPTKVNQEVGRPSSEAAYTLLADIHIWLEEWALAESALSNVIDAPGMALEANYADVFDPNNKFGVESIFEVSYLPNNQNASNFTYPWLPVPLSVAQNEAILGITGGEEDNNRQAFNIPSPELIAQYDQENDTRFAASIQSVQVQNSANFPTPAIPPTLPYISKFLHPHPGWLQAGENWPVYRYAEVKLMMAEAQWELNNGSTTALAHVNDVRSRAGLPPLASLTKADIMNERRLELAFEAKRYLDLKRTGMLESVMSAMRTAITNDPEAYYFPPGTTPPDGFLSTIATDYEIPTSEAALNPNID